ncbi:MAG: hypothetical protein HY695_01770 [Deltaproteobacteria bacterium]|nr:hypothetical protein [Deltaproteobacteria bacterium]
MKKTEIDKIPAGPELDTLVAENVMGWREVRRQSKNGERDIYVGKKQDKLGRWRSAEVRPYSTDPNESMAIESRMKELGLSKKYLMQLSQITEATRMPADWATPAQRCRAALKAMRTPLRLVRKPGRD